MNEMTPVPIGAVDDQLESIAKDIELTQATAVIRIAERLNAARDLFRYRRNGEGFVAWAETRLKFSQRTAYNLLSVHEKFGADSLQSLQTLPRSALYLLAADSTPDPVRAEIIERANEGEKLTVADIEAAVKAALEEEREAARKAAEAVREASREEGRASLQKEIAAAERAKQAAIKDLERMEEKVEAAQLKADAKVSAAQADLAKAQTEALQAKIDADAARAAIKSAVDKAREEAIQEHAESIQALRVELKAKEAAVREEYAGRFSFSEEELKERSDDILDPYRKRIEKLEQQIETLTRRKAQAEAPKAEKPADPIVPVDGEALLFCGQLCRWEREGLLARSVDDIMKTGTPEMKAEAKRLAPIVALWLMNGGPK